MKYLKEETASAINVSSISKFLALIGVASLLPFFIHLQWITGPIINAILIIILFLIDLPAALIACFIPSMLALAGGLLPPVLAPFIPFIMMGNVIYIFTINKVYYSFKNNTKGYLFGIIAGSFLKFIFIFFSVIPINNLIVKNNLITKLLEMVGFVQFATALAGGLIAWVFLKWLKRF